MHQTETGRPVTDAVVQEVCKLRPDMIGLSLRDCIEVRSQVWGSSEYFFFLRC